MKNIFILFLATFLGATACKKDNATDTPTASGGAATVTAGNYGFDGSVSLGRFSSTKAGIAQVSLNGVSTFSISAIRDGGNESISIIVLRKITATGKISFGPSLSNGGITISKDYTKPADLTLVYSTDRSTNLKSGGGELNITKLDGNSVEGTFYAVAYNSAGKEAFVEQGTFKGTIQ